MKIRTGYVSNSSTSSFLIAIKNEKNFEEMRNLYYSLAEKINEISEEKRNFEEFPFHQFSEKNILNDVSVASSTKEKIKKLLREGYLLAYADVSSEYGDGDQYDLTVRLMDIMESFGGVERVCL